MEEKFKLDMAKRPRRLRKGASMLSLCSENRLDPADMILPVFIMEGKSGSVKIPSMPGVFRHTVDSLLKLCEKSLKCGVRAIAPFPLVEASRKSPRADEAVNPKSLANRAIAAVKKRFPEMLVVADIALDPYTSHGHDGILDSSGSWILNDETVEILAGMSALAAQAGADFVAPSDMMDGRIGAIRATLDECDFSETAIMAYSAKYAPYEDWLRQCFYPLPVPHKKNEPPMRGSLTLPEFVPKTAGSRFGAMILELKTGRKRNKGSKRIKHTRNSTVIRSQQKTNLP